MSQTKVLASQVLLESGRTLNSTLGDVVSCLSTGASKSASSSDNSAAINSAITSAAAQGGFVLVPPGISYDETLLTMNDKVTLIVFSSTGLVTFLSKDYGASPVNKGGICLKEVGHVGVTLRAIDDDLPAEPILQLVDQFSGAFAGIAPKFVEFSEIADPTAPDANKVRLYSKDDGSGNTCLYAIFPTGAVRLIHNPSTTLDITATAVYDPASLADGAGVTTTIACAGASLGDIALASFSRDLQGILLTSYVSAADTVSVRFQNETGGVIDLASGTIKVKVLKS